MNTIATGNTQGDILPTNSTNVSYSNIGAGWSSAGNNNILGGGAPARG